MRFLEIVFVLKVTISLSLFSHFSPRFSISPFSLSLSHLSSPLSPSLYIIKK
uniref:Uncharacterized protein n=1 Tax=Medicago truncatula TaxID=3880 RepID=A2Q4Q9_MEDTR|nr:hypothetical protein MtrDRAFT_AC157507g20v2 [Medicago truncatula]